MMFALTIHKEVFYPGGKPAGYMREHYEGLTTEEVATQLNSNGFSGITAAYLSRIVYSRKPYHIAPIKKSNSTTKALLIPN